MTPFLVNFDREMGLLTKSEKKRFPRERKILESGKEEEPEREENRVEKTTRDDQQRRPAKRQKIAEINVAAHGPGARMARSATTRLRMPKTRS